MAKRKKTAEGKVLPVSVGHRIQQAGAILKHAIDCACPIEKKILMVIRAVEHVVICINEMLDKPDQIKRPGQDEE